MAESLVVLTNLVRRSGLTEARVISAASLDTVQDLVEQANELSPGGSILSTCRNGVYRSSMAASALSRERMAVLSTGTHSGLSYQHTRDQLEQGRPARARGIAVPAYDDPINLLIMCAHGESQAELREIAEVLPRLSALINDTRLEDFAILVLEGAEEEHTYY